MDEFIARNLARGVSWPVPTQRLLAASPVAHLLGTNEHLHPDVVLDLVRSAPDRTALVKIVSTLNGDLALLPACLDRARALSAQDDERAYLLDTPSEGGMDNALYLALGSASDAATARAAAELLPPVTGTGVACALGAIGVNLVAAAANMAPLYLMDWLVSPAANGLTDDQVWHQLRQWVNAQPTPRMSELLATVLLHRPNLHRRPSSSAEITAAQDLLEQAAAPARAITGVGEDLVAARASALTALNPDETGPHEVTLTAFRVAYLAEVGGWDDDQRDQLARAYEQCGVANLLGWAAAPVAAALDVEFTPPSHVAVTWDDLRWRDDSDFPVGLDMDVDNALAQVRGRAVGPLLAAALTDPDPHVEAGRWLVALRLADTFQGTFADLAATACAVHQPAG